MISATEPHKDHIRGIAVVQMARTISGTDFALTIVGPPGHAEIIIQARTKLCDPEGKWIRRIIGASDADLIKTLDEGFALLNTSKAEGFGLPILEAAARDVPVVHSRQGSLNEVIELGQYEPPSTMSLAFELVDLLDPIRYKDAVRRGRDAIINHSPDKFAAEFLSLILGDNPI